MRRTILVTGGAGFVGVHLQAAIERLDEKAGAGAGAGDVWIFTDRVAPRTNQEPNREPNHEQRPRSAFITCDLGDLARVDALLTETQPSTIVHLAGSTHVGAAPQVREALFRSNLMSTCNLLEVLRRKRDATAKAPHLVLASTGLIYGNQPGPFTEDLDLLPPNDYSLTKYLAEQAVGTFARQAAVRACILRIALLYGPGQLGDMFIPSLVAAMKAGRRFPMTAGAQCRDFLFVADMVTALLLAVGQEWEGTFNLGSGQAVALKEVGEAVAALFARPDLLGVGDLPYREREVWDYTLDSSRLRAKGWTPRTSLEEGLRRTINGETP